MLEIKEPCEKNNNIRVYTFGKFQMINTDCENINIKLSSEKEYKLLGYFLVNSNKSLSTYSIIENIYPENSYSDVKNILQNNIYRLRKKLKKYKVFDDPKKSIHFDSGCYRFNVDKRFNIDFLEFENEIFNGCNCHGNVDESIQSLENAFNMYKGDFLPNLIYEDWAVFRRNHYTRLYTKCINELTNRYMRQNRYDEVMKICDRALNYEPYEETIHIKVIDTLVKKGMYREAKKHYTYVTGLLYEQFNTSPSEEMQIAYRNIKEKNGYKGKVKSSSRKSESGENKVVEEDNSKAFYCKMEELVLICSAARKREDRKNTKNVPVMFSFSGDYNKNEILEIKNILLSSLRKGDIVAKMDVGKYIVYLVDTEYKMTKHVLERIVRRLKSCENLGKGNFEINRYLL